MARRRLPGASNVERALTGWADDCNRGQIGIAYFAGHGIIAPDGAT